MKRSKYTDEQILATVKEGEAGRKVADLNRTHGITEQTLPLESEVRRDGAARLYELLQWMAFGVGLVCLLLIRRSIQIGDGGTRLEALQTLVHAHTFDDMKFSFVGPLLALPFYLLGVAPYFNFCVFCVGLLCLGRVLRPMLNPGELRIFLLLLVFGSLFPFSTKDFFGETLSAVSLGVGTALLVKDREFAAAPWLVIGTANTPALVIPLTLLLSVRCYERKSLTAMWIIGPVLLVMAGDRWIRFQDLLISGYENDRGVRTFMPFSGRPGFSYPFFLGVVSILFSFGKGLLIYCPGLWAASTTLKGPVRKLAHYWLIFSAGIVIVYAKWWSWYGGQYWGPRFFLFCSLPASLFLASFLTSLQEPRARLARVACALFLLMATFWICFSGLRYGDSTPEVCRDNNFALESACWYIPEFSPVFRPLFIHQDRDETLKMLVPTWIFGFLVLAGPVVHRLLEPAVELAEGPLPSQEELRDRRLTETS